MATAKTMSTHALAAKMIRAELKRTFPGITFRVRGRVGSINIGWVDGPTASMVRDIVADYERGHVDGMIDIYEYTNRRDDIPQVDYVFCTRETSRETAEALVQYINRRRGWDIIVVDATHGYAYGNNSYTGNGYRADEVYRMFVNLSMFCGDCNTIAEGADRYCAECGSPLSTDRS